MKVHMLARELKVKSETVISAAQALGYEVSSHLNNLDDEQVRAVSEVLRAKRDAPSEPSGEEELPEGFKTTEDGQALEVPDDARIGLVAKYATINYQGAPRAVRIR